MALPPVPAPSRELLQCSSSHLVLAFLLNCELLLTWTWMATSTARIVLWQVLDQSCSNSELSHAPFL